MRAGCELFPDKLSRAILSSKLLIMFTRDSNSARLSNISSDDYVLHILLAAAGSAFVVIARSNSSTRYFNVTFFAAAASYIICGTSCS